MTRAPESIAILTYHSISSEAGPTSIPPDVFRSQMEAVADLGVEVVGLREVEEWLAGARALSRRTVAVTFDDAFDDFAALAHPVLDTFGFSACVFVPTDLVGGREKWSGANAQPRPLMDWPTIADLSKAGVSFGSHTRRHRDLTTLDAEALEDELAASRRELEDRIGKPAPHFAPPYGRSNPAVRRAIARHYSLSVGVGLGEARRGSPIHDLPRIEMHYYRDIRRWRAFLEGRGRPYFEARRAARGVREAAASIARRIST